MIAGSFDLRNVVSNRHKLLNYLSFSRPCFFSIVELQMRVGRASVEAIKSTGFNTNYTLGAPSHLLCKLKVTSSLWLLQFSFE